MEYWPGTTSQWNQNRGPQVDVPQGPLHSPIPAYWALQTNVRQTYWKELRRIHAALGSRIFHRRVSGCLAWLHGNFPGGRGNRQDPFLFVLDFVFGDAHGSLAAS